MFSYFGPPPQPFDWPLAIERNRVGLLRLAIALAVLAGLGGCGKGGRLTLPRGLQLSLLRMLRPAEAATRRLIVLARQLWDVTATVSQSTKGAARRKASASARGEGQPRFRLVEPLMDLRPRREPVRRVPNHRLPRISIIGMPPPPPLTPTPEPIPRALDEAVDGAVLAARIEALKAALSDLPAQAARLARWEARQAAMREGSPEEPTRPTRTSPLRFVGGPRPRKRRPSRGDGILEELQRLMALPPPEPNPA